MRQDGETYSASFFILAVPVRVPRLFQRSGKLPRKAATRNYNCIFPEPAPARDGVLPVPLHRGYSQSAL